MTAGPDLKTLLELFPPSDYLTAWNPVPAEHVPQPFHDLLVHEHHMTVTVEAYHGGPVDVRVLERRKDETSYARKIVLTLHKSEQIVLFGIVRIRLDFCSPEVRQAILSENTPLGRILINHDVLRRIEPTSYLRVIPGPQMREWFGMNSPTPVFGRLAIIFCDGQPAIELLEIVGP